MWAAPLPLAVAKLLNISLGMKANPAQDHLGGEGYPDSKLGPIRFSRFGVHREHVKSDFAFII